MEHVRSLGGLKAIAVSHPHYYGAVADWSEAFGGAPIYLHGDDRQWVTRPHPAIVPWTGDSHQISDDIVLVRAGGHFAGGTILHWRARRGAAWRAAHRGYRDGGDGPPLAELHVQLSELHSAEREVGSTHRRAVAPLAFDRIYGAWWGKNIAGDGKAAFDASVKRYLAAIS